MLVLSSSWGPRAGLVAASAQPACAVTWHWVCLCPLLFLQGRRAYRMRAHPADLAQLHDICKTLFPNEVTFTGAGGWDTDMTLGRDTTERLRRAKTVLGLPPEHPFLHLCVPAPLTGDPSIRQAGDQFRLRWDSKSFSHRCHQRWGCVQPGRAGGGESEVISEALGRFADPRAWAAGPLPVSRGALRLTPSRWNTPSGRAAL